MAVIILGIESSCDDTSAAISVDGKIYSNIIATQKIHEQYGGVVPELASRSHIQNIVPVVHQCLCEASNNYGSGIKLNQVSAIAFTQAPGLIGSLLVGSQFAKSLALSLNIPLIAVHHMQAHVLSNLIAESKPEFPFLCLTVSGGHTQIVQVDSPLEMKVLGQTIDDAAGEAFDKSAKMLGLPYPGGPLIDKYASTGNAKAFSFAEPKVPELDFSFSGLKTSILYFIEKQKKLNDSFVENHLEDLCASIQQSILNVLFKKLKKASLQTGIKNICIAGGVSANKGLRKELKMHAQQNGWKIFIPDFEFCTDNAAMIAISGHYKYLSKQFSDLSVTASARAEW